MDEKLKFVARLLEGEKMAPLLNFLFVTIFPLVTANRYTLVTNTMIPYELQ